MDKKEIDKKIEQYINAILICFTEKIVEDLEKQKNKGNHSPTIFVDKFLPFLKESIEKVKEDIKKEIKDEHN